MVGSDSPPGSAARRASGRRSGSGPSASTSGNHYIALMSNARSGGTPKKAQKQVSNSAQSSEAKLRAAAIEGLALNDFKAVLKATAGVTGPQHISAKLIVNSQDEHGATALHCAAVSHKPWILKELLAAGADPNIKDEDGNTALNLVLLHADVDRTAVKHCLMELLAASGNGARKAVIDTFDKVGLTPLMHAVRADLSEAVLVLLEHGADLTVKAGKGGGTEPDNLRGLTALQIAVQEDRTEVLHALLYALMKEEQQQQQHRKNRREDGRMSLRNAFKQLPQQDLSSAVQHMAQTWLVRKNRDDTALLQHYSKMIPGLLDSSRSTPVEAAAPAAAAAADGHADGDDSGDTVELGQQQQQQQEKYSKQHKRNREAKAAAVAAAIVGEQGPPESYEQQQQQGDTTPRRSKRRKTPVAADDDEQQQDMEDPASDNPADLLAAAAPAAEPAMNAAAATPGSGGVTPPTSGTSSRPVTPGPTNGVTPGRSAAGVTLGPTHGPAGVTPGPTGAGVTPGSSNGPAAVTPGPIDLQKTLAGVTPGPSNGLAGVTAGPNQSQKTPPGVTPGPGSGGTAGVSGGQKTPGMTGRLGSLTSPVNIGLTPMPGIARPSTGKKAPNSAAATGRQSARLAAAMGSSGSSVLDLKPSSATADLTAAAAGSGGPRLSRQAARLLGATPGGSSKGKQQQQNRELLQPIEPALAAAAGDGSSCAAPGTGAAAAAAGDGSSGAAPGTGAAAAAAAASETLRAPRVEGTSGELAGASGPPVMTLSSALALLAPVDYSVPQHDYEVDLSTMTQDELRRQADQHPGIAHDMDHKILQDKLSAFRRVLANNNQPQAVRAVNAIRAALQLYKIKSAADRADGQQALESNQAAAAAAAVQVLEQQLGGIRTETLETTLPPAKQQDQPSEAESPAAAAAGVESPTAAAPLAPASTAAGDATAEDDHTAAMDVDGSDELLEPLLPAAAAPAAVAAAGTTAAPTPAEAGSADQAAQQLSEDAAVAEAAAAQATPAAATPSPAAAAAAGRITAPGPADGVVQQREPLLSNDATVAQAAPGAAAAPPGSSSSDTDQQQQQRGEQGGADKENRRQLPRQQKQGGHVEGLRPTQQTPKPQQSLVEPRQARQQQQQEQQQGLQQTRRQLQLVPLQQLTPQQQQQQREGSASHQLPAATELQFAQLQQKAINLLLDKIYVKQQQGGSSDKLLDLCNRMLKCLGRALPAVPAASAGPSANPPTAAAVAGDSLDLDPELIRSPLLTVNHVLILFRDGLASDSSNTVKKLLSLGEITAALFQQLLLPAAEQQAGSSSGDLRYGLGWGAMQTLDLTLAVLVPRLLQHIVFEDIQKALQIAVALTTLASRTHDRVVLQIVAKAALLLLSSTAAVIAAGGSSSSSSEAQAPAALVAGKAVICLLELLSRTGGLLRLLHSQEATEVAAGGSSHDLATVDIDMLATLVGLVDKYKEVFKQSVQIRQELALIPAAAAAAVGGAGNDNEQLELGLLLLTRLAMQQQQRAGSSSSSVGADLSGLVRVVGDVLDTCGGCNSSMMQDLQLEVIESLNDIRDSMVC